MKKWKVTINTSTGTNILTLMIIRTTTKAKNIATNIHISMPTNTRTNIAIPTVMMSRQVTMVTNIMKTTGTTITITRTTKGRPTAIAIMDRS
jgi:hypothetical protein